MRRLHVNCRRGYSSLVESRKGGHGQGYGRTSVDPKIDILWLGMEEGSLLSEALRHQQRLRGRKQPRRGTGDPEDNDVPGPTNCLVVDVFVLPRLNPVVPSYFISLAETANSINDFIRSSGYPWYRGGDGPVFGVHTSPEEPLSNVSIPHLRCSCSYGVSVMDEWMLIHLVLTWIKSTPSVLVAAEFWDVEDGQILCIEASPMFTSPELSWINDHPTACRHRCWMVSPGHVAVIVPVSLDETENLTRGSALQILSSHTDLANSTSRHERYAKKNRLLVSQEFNEWIQEAIVRHTTIMEKPSVNEARASATVPTFSCFYQRTILALPRLVVFMIQDHAHFISAAVAAYNEYFDTGDDFEENLMAKNKAKQQQTKPAELRWEDWVWYKTKPGQLSRLHYAILRTVSHDNRRQNVVASSAHGSTDATLWIPPRYRSMELQRLQRRLQQHRACLPVSAHWGQHAIALGLRLVMGFDRLLQQQQSVAKSPSIAATMSTLEKRVLLYWKRIVDDAASTGDGSSSSWLVDAWARGSSDTATADDIQIHALLACPVYREEILGGGPTPLSHPDEESFVSLIRRLLQQYTKLMRDDNIHCDQASTNTKKINSNQLFAIQQHSSTEMPSVDDVDSDEWMTLPPDAESELSRRTSGTIPRTKTVYDSKSSLGSLTDNNATSSTQNNGKIVDDMLHGFKSFVLQEKSSIEGVDNSYQRPALPTPSSQAQGVARNSLPPTHEDVAKLAEDYPDNGNSWVGKSDPGDFDDPVHINPTVFLNMLHTVLKTEDASELRKKLELGMVSSSSKHRVASQSPLIHDPFFTEADYELMEPSASDDSGDVSDDGGQLDHDILDVMNVMDSELDTREGVSRSLDRSDRCSAEGAAADDCVAEDVHLLTNLLNSLEAGFGGPGPVFNMMKEMGLSPPDVDNSEDE
jgi:SGT1 protein